MHVRPEDGVQLIEVPLARMAQPLLPIALDALHRRETESQSEQRATEKPDKPDNEQYGVQRINAENEQVENEQRARCEQVCQKASTARLKVLQALAKGMNPDQAAIHLNISVTTVRSHMNVLYGLIRNAWELPEKYPMNFRDLRILFGDYFATQSDSEQQ